MAETVKINADTWRFEDGGVRFFLLCGKERAVLIDSGMNCPEAKNIAQQLTSLPLSLINTHCDPDHISGNEAFDSVYMHPDEEENYRSKGGRSRIIPVEDGEIIDLGERPLIITAIPGHTPGSIAIMDIRDRVIYAGDSVQDGNIFMFGKFRNIRAYADSMKRLLETAGSADTVYPCHGSFPVKTDIIPKLISGAEAIIHGDAAGSEVEFHGHSIMKYWFEYAGFLCDIPG